MIPIGYMYKTVVNDINSVAGCISANFEDYINYWKHNGYWLFDTPEIIEDLAKKEKIDLSGMTLFYYEAYEYEFDEKTGKWSTFDAEHDFKTEVHVPAKKDLKGFDVVEFSAHTNPGCSPLSCNGLAVELQVNRDFLFNSFAS